MTSRRRVPPSASIFSHRSVVVQEHDTSGIWSQCSLSLGLDRTKEPCLGNIVLRQLVHFEGFDSEQPAFLQLPPENLDRLCLDYSGIKDIPSAIHDHFAQNNPIRSTSQFLTLTLDMSAHGRVVVPMAATDLTPKHDHRGTIMTFQRLCQATRLLIYVPADRVSDLQKEELREFISLAHQDGALTSMPMNLQRIYYGTGAREATWEVFTIFDNPPAYSEQVERTTKKRPREVSPTLTPKRQEIDFSKPKEPKSDACICNTDTDTDFSAYALSPLPYNLSHVDVDLLHSAMRTLVQDALPSIVEKALSEMLPAVLKTTMQDILYNEIRGLQSGIRQDFATEPSQSRTKQDKVGQHPLTALIKLIIQEQLPAVIRQVMDDDGTYDDLIYEAQQQIEMVIDEEKDNALDKIREEREVCVRDVQKAGETSIGEIQEWGLDNNMIAQRR